MNKLIVLIASLAATLGLTACGAASAPERDAQTSNSSSSVNQPVPPTTTGPGSPAGPGDSNGWGICGNLNFSNVIFPASLKDDQAKAMALSLSVSGSFEGHAGWSNLAGDSDGMGISLGLLQQNLGTGSLQPLLLKLEKTSPSTLADHFDTADLKSLEGMLSDYQTASGIKISALDEASDELFPVKNNSPLDIDYDAPLRAEALNVAETASVKWAVATVLISTNVFVPRWKTALTAMAESAPYRTLQVSAALSMFDKALKYFDSFGFTQLRSLILMYDFVVQDGSFSAKNKTDFDAWVKAHPTSDETARLTELVTLRVATVRAAYQADVKVRKMTIVNGTGTVHGSARNLPKEYCYVGTEKI